MPNNFRQKRLLIKIRALGNFLKQISSKLMLIQILYRSSFWSFCDVSFGRRTVVWGIHCTMLCNKRNHVVWTHFKRKHDYRGSSSAFLPYVSKPMPNHNLYILQQHGFTVRAAWSPDLTQNFLTCNKTGTNKFLIYLENIWSCKKKKQFLYYTHG